MATETVPIRIYDPEKEIQGRWTYGASRFLDLETVVELDYSIFSEHVVQIVGHLTIKARYKLTEPTIEDIYSYSTNRFMQMGCLDGPVFPFYD